MNDAQIEQIAAQLEAAARVEGAKFRIESDLEASDVIANRLVANRTGFLCLAALLIRGAIAKENEVLAVLPTFENEDAEPLFESFERREHWKEETPIQENKRGWRDIFMTYGCVWLFFSMVAVFIVGLVTVFRHLLSRR